MPVFTTSAGDDLFYRDDCFAPPWATPPAVLLLHAEAESSLAWYGWMQKLSARCRVIRMDLRGAGQSIGMRPGQAWSLDRLAADVVALMQGLGVASAHLVAARLGGPVALRLAAAHPERIESLMLCSITPDPAAEYAGRAAHWIERIERGGIDAWAVEATQERLAGEEDEAMLQGWAGLLASADRDTMLSLFRNLAAFDAVADLPRIACPTLVATTDAASTLRLEATVAWQRRIPQAELLVLTGQGDHVAATHARELAAAALAFQRRNGKHEDRGSPSRVQYDSRGDRVADRERRRAERTGRRER
jgi:pimeloyl-ACP methyl ester carboxylesterase